MRPRPARQKNCVAIIYMPEKYRFDLMLSGWIFVWFLFYLFRVTKLSPFFVLVLGVVHNNLFYFTTILKQTLFNRLFFVVGNFFIKIVPVAYMVFKRQTKISFKDLVATLVVIAAYVLWLVVNRQTDQLKILLRMENENARF